VWLVILEDGSHPCLGATHLEINVNVPEGSYQFNEFGVFFNPEQAQNFKCEIPEIRFSGLEFAKNAQVEFILRDSTTEDKGVLATGTSVAFNVGSESPIQELRINLGRLASALKGTAFIWEPDDWWNVKGINKLQFRVTEQGQEIPVRAWYLTYHPQDLADPFPVAISNLPAPNDPTYYDVAIEARNETDQILRTWTGGVLLGQGRFSEYVTLN
jgi:hypothetical protein